jgi:hypothetical protein
VAGTDSTTAEPNAGKDTLNTYSGPTCSSTCCGAAVAKPPPHTRQTTPSRLPYSSLVQLLQTANASPYKTKSHIHHTERQALAADSTGHLHTHTHTRVHCCHRNNMNNNRRQSRTGARAQSRLRWRLLLSLRQGSATRDQEHTRNMQVSVMPAHSMMSSTCMAATC